MSDTLLPPWLQYLERYRHLLVPVGFIALLAVVVVPLPPAIMDLLLVANLALAALILMTTIFVTSPLDFSVFPSLLLGTTLMRLVLNIATTRLILGAQGESAEAARGVAGGVIETFASMVTSGSLVVGAILFIILIIVQFVVITKGATRISEVAARFTLDAMPGKQMAIDADLNAGLIDERDAKSRREEISSEADFYGAMDGAAKFVRGDAVAGILITLINILGGFAIGVFQNGWGLAESAEVFTSLTIGDGLVSQIPALIISIAAGLIVTRSSGKSDLGTDLTGQLTGKTAALGVTAVFLVVMAFTGLPMVPLLALAGVLAGLWFVMRKGEQAAAAQSEAEASHAAEQEAEPEPIEAAMSVDALELEVGYALVKLVDASQGGDLLDRISGVRRQLAGELGVVMPPVRIHDNMQLSPQDYHVKLRGNVVASGRLYPGQLLAIDSGAAPSDGPALRGVATREPAFGQRALWIEPGQRSRAESMHYVVVGPSEVAATHLAEIVRSHAAEMLSREETATLITNLREKAPKLCDEVLGTASAGGGGGGGGAASGGAEGLIRPGELQKVLQNLLSERVPIRDLETIVETLGDWASRTKDLEVLTEYVRNGLRRTICGQYAVTEPAGTGTSAGDDGRSVTRLYCVSLDPAMEDTLSGYIERSAEGISMTMPPQVANRVTAAVLSELQRLVSAGRHPVVLASPQVRSQVRRLLEPHLPTAAVLGYNEVSKGVEVESLGMAEMPAPGEKAEREGKREGGRKARPLHATAEV